MTRTKAGEIMSRVTNDLEKVSAIMQEGLPQLIASLFTILFAVLVMIKLNLLLFGVVLVSLAVSMAATGYVSKLAQRAYGENLASMGALTGKLEELYAGNRVVKMLQPAGSPGCGNRSPNRASVPRSAQRAVR